MRINKSLITYIPTSGAGSGTVTSVAMTVPSGLFTVVGTPITTSGTFVVGLVNQLANTVWAGPVSGAESVPTFRALVSDDIPNLNASKITSGTLSVARGGTGAVTLTGVIIGNGTSPFTGIASTTANQMLRVNSSGTAYEWFSPDYLSNPMTSLGDMIYGNAIGAPLRLPPNTTTTKKFLSMTGDGTIGDQPEWLTAVTSVGLTMPVAFSVSGSPVTTTGTLAVTAIGTATQYIRGDGQLATFPSNAGGGSSVSYYLNGSVTASVLGYKQMDNNAIIGGGTDFTLSGNGLIAQFLTDVGNPNRIQIPGGAWNFEMFFNSSSNGGNEKFFVELHKWDGIAFTLIASSSTSPEAITGGTSIDLYLTSLAVPTTSLLVTDRLAVRVYIVDNSAGRTITLHTENNTLCEIITTFAGGVASLNGLTANTQYFAVGTSGTDFNIVSSLDTHTFNLPSASASVRGALLSADWTTFNGKMANVFTSLGDMVYSNAAGAPVRRSGNITTTKMFLSQTGDGTNSAAPQWSAVTAADTGSVPTTRTLTINATTFDLSADRSWSVGTITSLTGEATASGTGAVAVTLTNSAVIGKVLTGLNVTGGSVVSTDTILQGFGKLQNQVNGLMGGVMYQGTWNASTNSPTLTSSVGTKGYYYVVSVAGSTNLNGVTDWKIGDWAIYNGTAWEKVDNTDSVTSVNGFTGAITLTTTNIAEGTNLYYTEARVNANTNVAANTAARHNALTIGTANGLSLSTQVLSLALASSSVTGALSSTDWTTFNAKQATISLTTTGSSGAATFITNTLNIPNYTAAGLGAVPTSRTLTINDVAFDLSADRSWSVGDYGTW